MTIETVTRRPSTRGRSVKKQQFGLSIFNRAAHYVSYTRSTFESSGILPSDSEFAARILLDEPVVQSDFERLLFEIDLLRRAVSKLSEDKSADLVFILLRFILHYKTQSSPVFTKVSVRILENCVALLKPLIANSSPAAFARLQDCSEVASLIKDPKCGAYIANTYYNYGIILWKDSRKAEAVEAWKYAVSVQRRFTVTGQSEMLYRKLERLAIAYVELKMFAEGADTLKQAIASMISEAQEKLVALSSIANLNVIVGEFPELDRFLSMYVNVTLQCDLKEYPFCFKHLSGPCEGIIGEWILKTLQATRKGASLVEPTVSWVAALYKEDCPIRYARLLVSVLPLAVEKDSKEKALESARDVIRKLRAFNGGGKDAELLEYKNDLIAGCSLYIGILEYQLQLPESSAVTTSVQIWPELTQLGVLDKVVVDREALLVNLRELHISDADDTNSEEILSDYLNIRGKLKNYILILHCLYKIANDVDLLLRCTISLSSTYLALGYSGKASGFLRSSHGIANSENISLLYLSEVEYFVAIGNLDMARERLQLLQDAKDNTTDFMSKGKTGYFSALLLLENGHTSDALAYAKAAVKIWNRAILQKTMIGELSSIWTISLVASIYSHQGLVRETEFYLTEALKLVQSFQSPAWTSYVGISLGDFYCRCGSLAKAEPLLKSALENEEIRENHMETIKLQHALARYYQKADQSEEQAARYHAAEALMMSILHGDSASSLDCDVEELLARLTIKDRKKQGPDEYVGINRLKSSLLRSKSSYLVLQEKWQDAEAVLQDAAACMVPRDRASQNMAESHYQFEYASSLLQNDPVFCVLQDSAISIPSINVSKPRSGKESLTIVTQKTRKPKTSPGRKEKGLGEVQAILAKSRQLMLDCYFSTFAAGSANEKQSVANQLGKVLLLQSAVGTVKDDVYGPAANYFFGLSLIKDTSAVAELSVPPDDLLANTLSSHSRVLNLNDFQKEFVDIIPQRWTAVSIGLCGDSGDLVVSRFQAGESPFLLRLPLNRHCSRDADENSFSFDDALCELQDIISRNNETTQASRKLQNGARNQKHQWWADRRALDARLKDLLVNIEYGWLGGFKGVLSGNIRNRDLLSKFSASFMRILKKHLPTRRSVRTRKVKVPEVKIDPRVLELFVGLGDPEETDNSEMLEDLIYFVLDILQFHGECNAYDELDMDQIVVDVQEILRAYYEAVEDEDDRAEHIVLILDKTVQMFPWESLPCLRNQSVSRLPSLASLRDILKLTGIKKLDVSKGAYVLNPSADLASTQTQFESKLKRFEEWNGIVGRTPEEDEFREYISTSDIFLYFGHGGGEQYIRPAQVKNLEKCAATFLLGCSSGVLHDSDEFEPWGTPMNYLIGGCPLLVSNLWDVTDKDIDKFADEMFSLWGLYENHDEACSLGLAISRAREVCNLKYLNGAAPVLYGIPLELLH